MTATPTTPVTASLARLARGPDAAAWSALVDEVGADLARTCAAVAGADLGQDALHETLLRLRDRAGRFAPPSDGDAERAERAARGWARRVAATTSLEMLRSRRRARVRAAHAPAPTATGDPADIAARGERDALVRRELAALPADQREAVTLHYLLGAPLADVAAAQGIAVEAAKKRAQRGAERLRARLTRIGVALSLPAALSELRAGDIPFDHARALGALSRSATPTIGVLKGIAVLTAIALPIVVAGALAVHGGADDVRAGDHPPGAATAHAPAAASTAAARFPAPAGVAGAAVAGAAPYPAVTVDFADVPLADALRMIAAMTKRSIRVEGDASDAPPVTLKVADMRLDDVLNSVTRLSGSTWRTEWDGSIVIASPPAKP